MDGFARHIAVDKGLWQALGHFRGQLKTAEPHGETKAQGAIPVQGHPRDAPADLIAGAINEQAARSQAGLNQPPDPGHVRLLVLTEHIESPHKYGVAGNRHFETTDVEAESGAFQRLGRTHPVRLNLDPADPHIRTDRLKPLKKFDGGGWRGAIAQVNNQRVDGGAEPPRLRTGEPPIQAAHTVRIGGAAGDVANRLPAPTSGSTDPFRFLHHGPHFILQRGVTYGPFGGV